MFPTSRTKRLIFLVFPLVTQVHRALLFNEAPFPTRVIFPFLVSEIGATGCASSVIPHSSFSRLVKNLIFAFFYTYCHFHDIFLSK